ncbi:MAG: hypothetical protein ACYDEB_05375 [Dehalococcoidia bacterium]
MPLFRRKPKPAPPLPVDLPPGEECERSLRATLLQGKTAMKGALYLTSRRLMFYADRGEARWLIVPFDEVKDSGLYPAPRVAMGAPGAAAECLFVETTSGEHVWWAFDPREERAWLPLVRDRAQAAATARESDGEA